MERSYIAFISYKHTERDAAIAKSIHSLIESYVVPKSLRKAGKKLGIVFRDEEELPISNDLTESICTALDASRYLIVICSPEAKESPWVAREVEYFLKHHDARNAFAVLANGEPGDVFPYALTHAIHPESGEIQEVEPLAMDARGDTIAASLRKVRSSIKKLYAAMLGCSYDSLVQREKARRMKRIVALVSLGVLVASCFAGVLFVKNRELSSKNDQLTAAISLALQRESQLLSEEAEEALQGGDMTAALQYASDALYSEDMDRPYHAPAERVLFSALDVFGEQADQILLSKVPLEHAAPIEMLSYSEDGSEVYTIDVYGTVSAFDAAAGDARFSIKLRENEDSFSGIPQPQLWYNAGNGSLICHYDGCISALDASTGSIIWEYEHPSSIVNGLFFDQEGQEIAFIERIYTSAEDMNSLAYEHNFISLSVQDGKLMHKIALPGAKDPDFVDFPTNLCYWASGRFMEAGRFAGTLFHTENGVCKSLIYEVDLARNSVRYIENETLAQGMDRYNYMRTFRMVKNRVLVVSGGGDLRMRCIDLESGSVLWDTTAEMDIYVSASEPCYLLSGEPYSVIASGKCMHAVDSETGEILASTTLFDEIIDLYPLKDGMFGFALENGYCAAGWKNAYGLQDSKAYNAVVVLPETPQLVVSNGGFVQQHYTDGKIDGFSVLPVQEGGGSVCYLSEDKCTAYSAAVLPSPKLPEEAPLEVQGAAVAEAGFPCDADRNGRMLMKNARQDGNYGVVVVDAANRTYSYIQPDDSIASIGDSYALAGDGLIANRDNGFVYRVSMDGSIDVLAENHTVTLASSGDMDYVSQLYKADFARQNSDGRLITARCTGEQINLWTDGENETAVDVPEEICWAVIDGLSIRSMFRAGENGLLVLSDFLSGESVQMENFAVYDLNANNWKQIADAAQGSSDRLIAFGEEARVFAVYDEDMHIRIYDYQAAEPVHCFRTNLPMVSVSKMGMLLEDQYVYILTRDGQFMIYSADTGEMVSRTIFTGSVMEERFGVWLDGANDRLYFGVDNETLCLDVRSWEELFRYEGMDDFKFFSAERNEACMSSYDSDFSRINLRAVPVPSTAEMIHIAREVLN